MSGIEWPAFRQTKTERLYSVRIDPEAKRMGGACSNVLAGI